MKATFVNTFGIFVGVFAESLGMNLGEHVSRCLS